MGPCCCYGRQRWSIFAFSFLLYSFAIVVILFKPVSRLTVRLLSLLIIYARLWIALIAPVCPTRIFTDPSVAVNVLNCYHRPGKYLGLAKFASAVGQDVSDSIRHVSHAFSHASAHQDQLWNELVDSLAKATAFCRVCPSVP